MSEKQVGGLIVIGVGLCLCLTVVGAPVGIPVAILGWFIMNAKG